MIISPPPADLRGERKKARMHFAVIRLPYGNSSCGKKRGCVATASADEVPAYSGAECHRWQMELDLPLLARFRHAPVQRAAPANARDFPQGPSRDAPQPGARGTDLSHCLCGDPAAG